MAASSPPASPRPPDTPVAQPPPLFGRMGPGGPGGPGGLPLSVQQAKDRRGTVRRLWEYLQREHATLALAAVLVACSTGLNVLGPYLLGQAIDRYIVPGDLPGLTRIGALMLLVYAATSVLMWLQSYVMAGAAQRTVRALRNDLFGKLQTLPLRFFDQRAHGELMSRLTNDVENVNLVLTDNATQLVSGVLGMAGVAAVMLWLNLRLALIALVVIPALSLTINRWIARRTREGFRHQQRELGALNGLIEETVTGQRVVKAFHREPVAIAEFDAANRRVREAATGAQIYAAYMGPLNNLVGNLGLAIVACVGGWMAVQGLVTIGTIASFVSYTRQLGRPLNDIANLYNTIQSALAGAERVFEVLDEPGEVDAPGAQPLSTVAGDVVFDQVNFAYEAGVPVLKGISLHAQPDQVVALVGPTGAGKTTIVNLLTRFYEIDSGRIAIDGRDIRDLRKDDLRRRLGIVLQDTFLFAGTVMDNIRYGRLNATDEEVMGAARLANADQFIHRLPHGYDTLLSERAGNLSQGQRQLLAIARAVLANPSILILDEATSSVDTRTEQHIQEAMLRLMAGRTSFVIAHRLSTIRTADQILVVYGGEIVERGTHDSLLAQHGFYARLYASQFRATVLGDRAWVLAADT